MPDQAGRQQDDRLTCMGSTRREDLTLTTGSASVTRFKALRQAAMGDAKRAIHRRGLSRMPSAAPSASGGMTNGRLQAHRGKPPASPRPGVTAKRPLRERRQPRKVTDRRHEDQTRGDRVPDLGRMGILRRVIVGAVPSTRQAPLSPVPPGRGEAVATV